ncbi:MAG: hypothetical protein ACODAE_04475, partial [Gemmatimonadota bacterium]
MHPTLRRLALAPALALLAVACADDRPRSTLSAPDVLPVATLSGAELDRALNDVLATHGFTGRIGDAVEA